MSKIKVMSEELANKIAAGEVVERPASVVKELLENALDAKASEVKIDLVESGLLEISITDNGLGMDYEDAKLAFKRHATSKVITENDLLKIITLGFRGEALPSIAAVSDVELKTSDGVEGALVNVKGSKLIKSERSDLKKGTKITVRNLFYNTPARLKHLKNVYTELSHISDYVHKISLSRSDVAFTLTNNGKVLLRTDGKNNLLKTIASVYSIDIAKEMLVISGVTSDYKITGFTSKPILQRGSRNYVSLIVNNRIIKSSRITKAILDSYYTYIPYGKHPISVLSIEVDPTLIDVNVHPNKLEVKFSKEDELLELIRESVIKALKTTIFIPKVVKEKVEIIERYEEIQLDLSQVSEDSQKYETPVKVEVPATEETPLVEKVSVEQKSVNISQEIILDEPIKKETLVIYPIGQVMGTYIIGQNENGLYMIDQHAAAERIRYEYYKKQIVSNDEVKDLLVPLVFDFSLSESIIIEGKLDVLNQLNIEVEKFGSTSFRVRSHPIWFKQGEESEDILKIFKQLLNQRVIDLTRLRESIVITMSCKLSLKANHSLSILEMERLLSDLMLCDNPNTCPHGRPVIVHISGYELEKMFKRVK